MDWASRWLHISRYDRIWINPDCGLKTREWHQVIPSLRNMVEAARLMRERVGAGQVKGAEQGVKDAGGDDGRDACCGAASCRA